MSEQKHGTADVWKRLNEQGDSIAQIAAAQAKTDAKLDALADRLDAGISTMTRAVTDLSSSVNRPTNWVGVGGLIAVITSGLISFVVLVNSPTDDKADRALTRHTAVRDELEDRAYEIGSHQESRDWVERELDQIRAEIAVLQATERTFHYTRGRLEELSDRVDDMDNLGSRRWVNKDTIPQ